VMGQNYCHPRTRTWAGQSLPCIKPPIKLYGSEKKPADSWVKIIVGSIFTVGTVYITLWRFYCQPAHCHRQSHPSFANSSLFFTHDSGQTDASITQPVTLACKGRRVQLPPPPILCRKVCEPLTASLPFPLAGLPYSVEALYS
jgi:hypothetical protein